MAERSRRARVLAVAGYSLLVLAAAAQVVPVERGNPPVTADLRAPPEVHAVLRRACYDCHSNETVWPWYAGVAPVSWLVARDVREGRDELNFSAWDPAAPRAAKALRKCAEELREGEMPPGPYVALHPQARLGEAERALLLGWLDAAGREEAGRGGDADGGRGGEVSH